MSIRRELPPALILLTIVAIAAVTWPRAPHRLPVHWNLDGQVDRWGSKDEALLVVPVLAAFLSLLIGALSRVYADRPHAERLLRRMDVVRVSVLVLLAVVYAASLAPIYGINVSVMGIMPFALGGFFIVLGTIMLGIPPNSFLGARTPWTTKSPEVWRRTQTVGGILLICSGLAGIGMGLVNPQRAVLVIIAGALVAGAATVAYSYLVARDGHAP